MLEAMPKKQALYHSDLSDKDSADTAGSGVCRDFYRLVPKKKSDGRLGLDRKRTASRDTPYPSLASGVRPG